MELVVEKFSGGGICRFDGAIYSSGVPEFSYTFKPGIYALLGEIDQGGWAFSYALDPIKKDDIYLDGEHQGESQARFYMDGQEVTLDYLRTISYHLGSYAEKESDIRNKSGQKQIQKAIKEGTSRYTMDELKKMFDLSESRFDRPIYATGNEKWWITAAIGLAQGKKIFCYPWMTGNYLNAILASIKTLADVLREQGAIILLPIEKVEFIKGFVDDIVDLRYHTPYGNLISEELISADNKTTADIIPDRKTAIELADVILKNYPKPDIYKNCSLEYVAYDKREAVWVVHYYDFSQKWGGKRCSVVMRQEDGKVLKIWFEE